MSLPAVSGRISDLLIQPRHEPACHSDGHEIASGWNEGVGKDIQEVWIKNDIDLDWWNVVHHGLVESEIIGLCKYLQEEKCRRCRVC